MATKKAPLVKSPTKAGMRQILAESLRISDDPDQIIRKAHKAIMSQGPDDALEKNGELISQAVYALAFENDYTLVETMDEQYRGMAIDLRRQLIKDFDCNTHAERVLVDTIVSGYVRTIRCAKSFNNCTHEEFLSSYKNQYMANVSKELDRAQRQLMAAYQMLVNLKRPPLKVQVKAKTAFVAENQQLNVAQPQPTQQDNVINNPV